MKLEKRLQRVMRDYGYTFCNSRLTRKGVRGFTSNQVLPFGFKNTIQAAEWLIPVIREDEYSRRVRF